MHNKDLRCLYSSPNIGKVCKVTLRRVGHV